MSSPFNYTGETIHVGIDVHKNSYSVVSIYDGEVVKKDRIVASPIGLVDYLRSRFSGAKINSAYEAGFSGFHLHRFLVKHGINNMVVNPSAIEVARERVKTDKRDALKIGTQLESGRLKSIHIPNEKQEANRMVTRLRSKLMNDRRRYSNQIKALLHQYGLIAANDESVVSKKWINQILELIRDKAFLDGFTYSINSYIEQWLNITEKVKEIDQKLQEQSKEENRLDRIYQSAPGIGPLTARTLANELGDMKQFSSEKKLFSFIGLTPREYSSGDNKWLGSISRQGRPILRGMLVEAAWIAIKKDENLNRIFTTIAKRAGSKRAIVGIARRLIGRIRACIIKNVPYQYDIGC